MLMLLTAIALTAQKITIWWVATAFVITAGLVSLGVLVKANGKIKAASHEAALPNQKK